MADEQKGAAFLYSQERILVDYISVGMTVKCITIKIAFTSGSGQTAGSWWIAWIPTIIDVPVLEVIIISDNIY